LPTDNNLKAAFAGESQANRKYLAFAKKADEEGFPGVAKLFRAAAEAETIHAMSEFKAMDGIKTTAENLKTAVEGETYEFTEMYPGFISEASILPMRLKRLTRRCIRRLSMLWSRRQILIIIFVRYVAIFMKEAHLTSVPFAGRPKVNSRMLGRKRE